MGKTAISLSGGKDSVAMLLRLALALGQKPDVAIFFDGGWEWPECIETVHRVCEMTGVPLYTVGAATGRGEHRRAVTFDYMLSEYVKTKGKRIGERGYGWPGMATRWCTRMKCAAIDREAKRLGCTTLLVGFGADEKDRTLKETIHRKKGIEVRFPLVEWGMTEAQALQYCKDCGFEWNGLYDVFPRVSCWCCPLQSNGELRALHDRYPAMWQELRRKQESIRDGETRFKGGRTVHEWEAKYCPPCDERTSI